MSNPFDFGNRKEPREPYFVLRVGFNSLTLAKTSVEAIGEFLTDFMKKMTEPESLAFFRNVGQNMFKLFTDYQQSLIRMVDEEAAKAEAEHGKRTEKTAGVPGYFSKDFLRAMAIQRLEKLKMEVADVVETLRSLDEEMKEKNRPEIPVTEPVKPASVSDSPKAP